MRPAFRSALFALLLGISPVFADGSTVTGDPTEDAARADFSKRMGVLNDTGNWQALLENGLAWQKSHPKDANGWFTQARGAYFLGDYQTAIAAWEKAIEVEPFFESNAKSWLDEARAIKANFPGLKLQPITATLGENGTDYWTWIGRGEKMLASGNYDGIEKTAATLQRSNAASIKGTPYLFTFFEGLRRNPTLVARWVKARPKSGLARLSSVMVSVDAAWEARGDGWASSITPAMEKKMVGALTLAAKKYGDLPETAFGSPLSFVVGQRLAQLAGGREASDALSAEGIKRFPQFLMLYRYRATQLLPRWFGEDGELEEFLTRSANKIGGENGDIFYARMIWELVQRYGADAGLGNETPTYDAKRAARGLLALQKRRGDLISLRSARLYLAYYNEDWKTAQSILIGPKGHILDGDWANPEIASKFWGPQRMTILAQNTR